MNYTIGQTPEDMKAWKEYMIPRKVHMSMKSMCGEWNAKVSMYLEPESKLIKYTGTTSSKMILGGRYQETVFKGKYMGQVFEGKSITGYDNAKKVFYSTWIDNMGTGILYTEGKMDTESQKALSENTLVKKYKV